MTHVGLSFGSRAGRQRRRGGTFGRLVFPLGLLVALAFLAPIVWTVVTSVKPPDEASAAPPTGLPSRLDFANYATLRDYGAGIVSYVWNSIQVCSMTIIGTLILGTLGGYGFSRFRFPLKGLLFVLVLALLMIPFQSLAIPMFMLVKTLGLVNSLFGVALVYITFQMPFAIFVMRNAFDQIHREIEDSALVDGASQRQMILHVMLPLAIPGLVTVGLFSFLAAWNEFFAAFILLTRQSAFTLPIMLLSAQGGLWFSINWGSLQAGVTIAMVPCLVLYVLLQRYYVEGVQTGAVKG